MVLFLFLGLGFQDQGITYALIGPKLLFADPIYAPMLYGFLVGALATILLYILHRLWPRARFVSHIGSICLFFFLIYL